MAAQCSTQCRVNVVFMSPGYNSQAGVVQVPTLNVDGGETVHSDRYRSWLRCAANTDSLVDVSIFSRSRIPIKACSALRSCQARCRAPRCAKFFVAQLVVLFVIYLLVVHSLILA